MDPFLESSSLNRQIYFPISNRLNFYPHTMHQTFLVIYKFFPLQIDLFAPCNFFYLAVSPSRH